LLGATVHGQIWWNAKLLFSKAPKWTNYIQLELLRELKNGLGTGF
jgi:hypothetical protein